MRIRLISSVFTAVVVLVAVSAATPLAHAAPACFGKAATIVATGPGVTTYGTSGPDVIVGTTGDDIIRARGGDDLICGLKRRDRLYGQKGSDRIAGGYGDDFLSGDLGAIDYLDGGAGNDILDGGGGTAPGTDGADIFKGNSEWDTVSYANATRAITASLQTGKASGEGADTFDGVERIVGSAFGDSLSSDTEGSNWLEGNGGNDLLVAPSTRWGDVLMGGAGNDRLEGGSNELNHEFGPTERLEGGPGDDTLLGNGSPWGDEFFGGPGSDRATGGEGPDYFEELEGGADEIIALGGADWINAADGVGDDHGNGGAGIDTCVGDTGDVLTNCE